MNKSRVDIGLSFQIMINSEKSVDELMRFLAGQFHGAAVEGGYLILGSNVMSFSINPTYDERLSIAEINPDFYYRIELSVFPRMNFPVTLEQQIDLALNLRRLFRSSGDMAEIISEFTLPSQ